MRLHEAIVIPRQGSRTAPEPLRDDQSVRVYHGTPAPEVVLAALTRGISGGSHVVRTYSFEQNNNPRGLFVSPDIKTAKEFGDYIIEFHSRVRDLESPVWPNGTFTSQGGMSGVFSDEQEREMERMAKRNHWSQSDIDYISSSDRPEVAAMFLHAGERQALFTGDLNANSIRAVWVSRDPSRVGQQFDRVSPREFIEMYEDGSLPSRYGHPEVPREVKRRLVDPRDNPTGQDFIDAVQATRKIPMPERQVIDILQKNPQYIRDRVWSERQFDMVWRDVERM